MGPYVSSRRRRARLNHDDQLSESEELSLNRDSSAEVDTPDTFAAGGEMGALMRTVDWAATPLGPVRTWSQALRTMVGLLLRNQFPMLLWWGPRFVQLYNDAYRPVLGSKHPRSMGQPVTECWTEIWNVIGPMIEAPFRGEPATTSEDLFLLVNRKGFVEETHFKVAYSPVPDETAGPTGIGGVLATVAETTEQVYAQRQLRTLRELGARGTEAATAVEACVIASAAFEANDRDVPFVLVYLLDEDGQRAQLAGRAGFGGADHPAAPAEIDMRADEATLPWPLASIITGARPWVLERADAGAGAQLGSLPRGHWAEPPAAAIALPLASPEEPRAYGVLVCGVSPHRALDAGYRSFFELAAAQVVTAVRNARAHEAQRRRAEALVELDRAKTAFFSNVSHEFRTPLTLMLGPQEDALASPEGTLGGEALRVVHRNTQRLLKLVNTLLRFSRIEAGRAQASYEPTDLGTLTRDLASAFRSTIESGGLAFEVDCPPLPEPVYVDRDMWERIVLNLLSNAFKFTFEGRIAVALRAAGDHVELSVADSGVGIPEHELPRVFERFHRIEGTRARTFEGSGIGLALVHELARLHGGDIRVTSQVGAGAGSTFTMSVPRGRDHLPPERVRAARPLAGGAVAAVAEPFVQEALRWVPAPAQERPPSAAPEARILVADDNADMREYVTRILGQQWTVDPVSDGVEALAAARAAPPDLVLTDVMMPGLDGFGLLRALRADPITARVPVIMLSARAGEESRVEGLAAGADDYLVKPFAARELLARVSVHLENNRLRRAVERERNQLRSLLGQVPAIVNFLRGPELVFEFAHPLAVATLHGRDVLGKPLTEAVPELRDQEYPALLRRVVETGRRVEGKDRLVRLDDGHGRLRDTYWNFVYLPVRDADGRVEGVMTFDLEVTDQVVARRKIEEQAQALAEANREAERARAAAEAANRGKDEFLAMLGHEMRNPLAPILTSLQLMRIRGGKSREHAIIERQVDHLVRLVDDLLDISRITQGKIDLKKERLELIDAVLGGVEIASPLLEARRQHLDIRVPQEGLPVVGDPDRLAQVVSNLVTNASKYSELGTTIRITAERLGAAARLRVRDNGVGIAPDMLTHVFEPFVQQPQSLERSKGGLGLGLAIVRSLVELHGGRASASSDGLGKGSTFVIDLPLAPGAEEIEELSAEPAGTRPAARDASGKRRILVVDDNEDAAESLAEILDELGYQVATAHDGPSALNIVKAFRPDVCLVDIGLPVMDGYELAQQLRGSDALPEDARIIAITGYGQEADRRRSREAGFNAHLVKPVSMDALTRTLVN
jgi:signal transduction histidine kinase/DNA-binding response OmpR family regulator